MAIAGPGRGRDMTYYGFGEDLACDLDLFFEENEESDCDPLVFMSQSPWPSRFRIITCYLVSWFRVPHIDPSNLWI